MFEGAFMREKESAEQPALVRAGLVEVIGEDQGPESSYLDATFLRRYSVMTAHVGERGSQKAARVFRQRLFPQTYVSTVDISLEDVEDGKADAIFLENRAAELTKGYRARQSLDMAALLQKSISTDTGVGIEEGQGYSVAVRSVDGVPLFSDEHPVYEEISFDIDAKMGQRLRIQEGGTYSNLVNEELSLDALWNVVSHFRTMKNPSTGLYAVNQSDPLVLYVSPQNERKAREILNSTRVNDGNGAAVTNIAPDMGLQVIQELGEDVTADLTFGGTEYTGEQIDMSQFWFVAQPNQETKPFVLWNRKNLQLQQTASASLECTVPESVFRNGEMSFGARARWTTAYGDPTRVYGSLGGHTFS
jgi:phage major head subunit gpT-like protein